MAKSKVTATKSAPKKTKNTFMVFKKQNYMLLIASVVTLVIGFIVMGSGKDKPFDDPMKITIAPLIVLLGFAIGVVSILYTPKSQEEDTNED
jgi:hypothetical protein